jgi:hypothetical protein
MGTYGKQGRVCGLIETRESHYLLVIGSNEMNGIKRQRGWGSYIRVSSGQPFFNSL